MPVCLLRPYFLRASQPYRGLKIPKVAEWHKNVATLYGTMLWLWLFYRAKNDGPALLVRRSPSRAQPHAPPLARRRACAAPLLL